MSKTRITPQQFIMLVLLLLICPILMIFAGVDYLLVLVIEIFQLCFVYCLLAYESNVFFLAFLVSFFVFLISGDLVEQLTEKRYWLQFDTEVNNHAHICILISLIFIFIGYVFTKKPKEQTIDDVSVDRVYYLKHISKILYYSTYTILIFNTFNKIVFVSVSGYVAYYVSYNPILPNFIVQIGDLAPIALCSFLVTMPSKKEAKLPLILFFIYAVSGLLVGQRGALVYNATFIIAYLIYRNKTDKGLETWIGKKTILVLILSIPAMIVFLYAYGFTRVGVEYSFNSVLDTILSFFVNVGASSKVIKEGYIYNGEIEGFKFYSLGDTLNYFKYSRLFTVFTGVVVPSAHSAEFALQSHSFDAFISYQFMRTNFLRGQGAGSSFIACLFADFGYLGVGIGSFFYGYIFKKISSINSNKWLTSTMKLYAMLYLIKAPRGSYDGAIGAIINVTFIFTMTLIRLLATIKKKSAVQGLTRLDY